MVMIVERKRSPSEAEPTDFGWLLTILMRKSKRRLKSASALARALKADSYPISQQMVSRYINGQSRVPIGFVSQVIKTLDLDKDDQSALSNKWAETLPEEERAVIMHVWESRRLASENIEAARHIEAARQVEGEEITKAGRDGVRGSKDQEG